MISEVARHPIESSKNKLLTNIEKCQQRFLQDACYLSHLSRSDKNAKISVFLTFLTQAGGNIVN